MEWLLNFLIKLLGGFFTGMGLIGLIRILETSAKDDPFVHIVIFLTIGLALLFSPKIEKK